MSAETYEWLNTNVLVGFTDPTYGRGNAWHYRADLQGDEPNHYQHAIPVDDVLRRLFHFQALEAPVYVGIEGANGTEYIRDTTRKAIVRSDDPSTIFSVFKAGYVPHQYKEWLIDTVANIIDDSDLAIGTAGLLKNGARAFVTVELPDTVKTPSGFDIRPHLLACTSHDGTLASTFQLVSTIVVCDNTLAGALSERTPSWKVRHTKNSVGTLSSVRDALNIVWEYTDDLKRELERLSSQVVTDNEFKSIVEHLVPVDLTTEVKPAVLSRAQGKRDILHHLYKNDPRVTPWSGTALGVYQAWNTYCHHFFGRDENRVERNMLNAITGKSQVQDQLVLDLIDSLVMS